MLLDTSEISPNARADVIADVISRLGIDCSVEQERDSPRVHARLDAHVLGDTSTFTYAGSGIRMIQTARVGAAGVVAVAVQGRRAGILRQYGRQSIVLPGALLVIDRASPFDYRWHGDGGAMAVNVPVGELGLPDDALRRAADRLPTSPLHDLVRQHIRSVCTDAARLVGEPGAAEVGRATLVLVRALVATAAAS